jgi:hypothetical protein
MFQVEVSSKAVPYARQLVTETNFGTRGVADGSPGQQVAGLVGQAILHDLLGIERPYAADGPDGGVDLVYAGLTISVKVTARRGRPRLDHRNNFNAARARLPTDILVFCSYDVHCSLAVSGSPTLSSSPLPRGASPPSVRLRAPTA